METLRFDESGLYGKRKIIQDNALSIGAFGGGAFGRPSLTRRGFLMK